MPHGFSYGESRNSHSARGRKVSIHFSGDQFWPNESSEPTQKCRRSITSTSKIPRDARSLTASKRPNGEAQRATPNEEAGSEFDFSALDVRCLLPG